MTQETLNLYDEFLSEVTQEMAEMFDTFMLDPEGNPCVVCLTEDYLENNQTRFMNRLYQLGKENPSIIRFLLVQLGKQFDAYKLMSDQMLASHDELFPETDANDCT
tara:strand:+ start:324 stop:641 length:318 start_codon:yes stop_codon:yes gene_type:complete